MKSSSPPLGRRNFIVLQGYFKCRCLIEIILFSFVFVVFAIARNTTGRFCNIAKIDYFIISKARPTSAKAANALSRCSLLWAAET